MYGEPKKALRRKKKQNHTFIEIRGLSSSMSRSTYLHIPILCVVVQLMKRVGDPITKLRPLRPFRRIAQYMETIVNPVFPLLGCTGDTILRLSDSILDSSFPFILASYIR